jgi:MFS transporter, DHA1 family, inner membrane transport protein
MNPANPKPTRDSGRLSRVEWIALISLACAQCINILDFMIVMPLGPRYRDRFSMTPEQFGHVVAIYGFTAFVAGVVSAGYIDRYERKRAMLIVFAALGLSTLACAVAASDWQLFFARGLCGVFGGIVGSLVMTIVSDLFADGRRGFAFGIVGLAFSIASIAGVPVSLVFADLAESVRAPFLAIFAASAVVWVGIAFSLPRLDSHLRNTPISYWTMLRIQFGKRSHLLSYLFSVLIVFSSFTVAPYIATYMVTNVGIKQHDVKYIYIVGGLATFLVMPGVGRMTDRIGKFPLFLTLILLMTIPTVWITNLPEVAFWVAILCTTIYMSMTSGRMVPAQAILALAPHATHRAGFMSMNSAVQHLSCGLAASLTAVILGGDESSRIQNFPIAGIVAVSAAILSLPIAWVLSRGGQSATAKA